MKEWKEPESLSRRDRTRGGAITTGASRFSGAETPGRLFIDQILSEFKRIQTAVNVSQSLSNQKNHFGDSWVGPIRDPGKRQIKPEFKPN